MARRHLSTNPSRSMVPAKRNSRFFTGFLATLATGLILLHFSPYTTPYAVPARNIYVDWYQDNSIWADLTHGVSDISDDVRRADVLVLGSSKTLFGISARTLNERFEKDGLRFFNLGIGGGEGARGAAQIITMLDLRHKILLINLDDNMLSSYLSASSIAALQMDWFKAATRVASVRTKTIGDTLFDQAGLPQLRYEENRYVLSPRSVVRSYRELTTGDAVSPTRIDTRPVGQHSFSPAPAETMLLADELDGFHFKKILRNWMARDMHFVFFSVPYGLGDPHRNSYNPALPRLAAERYGGKYVDLDWRLAKSFDYVHVDRQSRERLSKSLADQLADPSHALVQRALEFRSRAAREH
jgi:hypothetical protein